MQHDYVDLLTGSGAGGSGGKIVATMLLHFVIPFNMQHDGVLIKVEF